VIPFQYIYSPPLKEAADKEVIDKAKADKKTLELAKKQGKQETAAANASEADEEKFNVGDKVRTVAVKCKDKFDGMLAEVVSIKKSTYRVQILEGPAKLTMKDFTLKNLVAVSELPPDDTLEDMEAKRQKLAGELFGDTLE
jgi:hypothetical protein